MGKQYKQLHHCAILINLIYSLKKLFLLKKKTSNQESSLY